MISFAVSEKALDSFKNEWGLEEDQYVRIYAKYLRWRLKCLHCWN